MLYPAVVSCSQWKWKIEGVYHYLSGSASHHFHSCPISENQFVTGIATGPYLDEKRLGNSVLGWAASLQLKFHHRDDANGFH